MEHQLHYDHHHFDMTTKPSGKAKIDLFGTQKPQVYGRYQQSSRSPAIWTSRDAENFIYTNRGHFHVGSETITTSSLVDPNSNADVRSSGVPRPLASTLIAEQRLSRTPYRPYFSHEQLVTFNDFKPASPSQSSLSRSMTAAAFTDQTDAARIFNKPLATTPNRNLIPASFESPRTTSAPDLAPLQPDFERTLLSPYLTGRESPSLPRPNRTDANGERIKFASKHDFLKRVAEVTHTPKAAVADVGVDHFNTLRIPGLRASESPALDSRLPSWKP